MVESESLVSGFDRLVAGFDEFVNLLLGVATGFGEEDLDALDGGSFDFLVAVGVINIGDFAFQVTKNTLRSG